MFEASLPLYCVTNWWHRVHKRNPIGSRKNDREQTQCRFITWSQLQFYCFESKCPSVRQILRVTPLAFLCVTRDRTTKNHDTETARFVLLRADEHVKTLRRQTRGLWCSATFFPEVTPTPPTALAPSCFSRNVRAQAVMSLAWLTDASLEGSSNSCNVATRGKKQILSACCVWLGEWSSSLGERGIPLLFRNPTHSGWLLKSSGCYWSHCGRKWHVEL